MSAAARPCPICGQPADPAHRPFCSPRCRNVDLHRWLSSAYAIPSREEEEDEEDGPGAAGAGSDESEDEPGTPRH
ncbi:MAG: DNA gyrase inhibitor YacG [Alphaproteobacteria bacterium]|nr:DNA gyrase inhibitor YacG [Alphaproteobacteria bacterium]